LAQANQTTTNNHGAQKLLSTVSLQRFTSSLLPSSIPFQLKSQNQNSLDYLEIMLFITKSLTVFLALIGSASSFAPIQRPQGSVKSSRLRMADFSLDPKETAFVFIEYQNEFATEGGKLHEAVKDAMDKTNSKWHE
jgi:hypothetical protein